MYKKQANRVLKVQLWARWTWTAGHGGHRCSGSSLLLLLVFANVRRQMKLLDHQPLSLHIKSQIKCLRRVASAHWIQSRQLDQTKQSIVLCVGESRDGGTRIVQNERVIAQMIELLDQNGVFGELLRDRDHADSERMSQDLSQIQQESADGDGVLFGVVQRALVIPNQSTQRVDHLKTQNRIIPARIDWLLNQAKLYLSSWCWCTAWFWWCPDSGCLSWQQHLEPVWSTRRSQKCHSLFQQHRPGAQKWICWSLGSLLQLSWADSSQNSWAEVSCFRLLAQSPYSAWRRLQLADHIAKQFAAFRRRLACYRLPVYLQHLGFSVNLDRGIERLGKNMAERRARYLE